MRFIVSLLVFVLIQSGCVLKAKHDETLARQLQCDAEMKKVLTEREQLTQKLEESKHKLSDTESRNEELSQTNQMLVNKNSEITKKTTTNQEELLAFKSEKIKSEQQNALLKQTYDDLFKAFGSELENQSMELHQTESAITITIPETNLFTSQADDLTATGKKRIDLIGLNLKKIKANSYRVESSIGAPPSKKSKSKRIQNAWERSAVRASKVTEQLEKNGINPSSLQAVGLGESHSHSKQKEGEVEIVILFF